jgi:hypothetical protein
VNRKELAMRLRWLADMWEQADGPLKERIERAFRNGYARGMAV